MKEEVGRVLLVTAGKILREAVEKLKLADIGTPQLDAEVILSDLLQVERIKLHIYPDMEISREICQKFWCAVEKRLKNMPVQYIVNRQEFMGLELWVEEGVLIPRGDTEILVEKVLELYRQYYSSKSINVLDIGVGSGAITISVAKYIEQANLYGIDVSPKALAVAIKNAEKHHVENQITFFQGSLLEPLEGKSLENGLDFILSNPPYIPRKTIETLSKEVKDYEPSLALDGGEDGLYFYREIVKRASVFLKKGGWLVFEIGYDQGKALQEMMKKEGFTDIEVTKDLAGLDRVVVGRIM